MSAFIELIYYAWGISSGLIFAFLTVIQVKRLYQKLTWVYNDLINIISLVVYLAMVLFMMINIILSLMRIDSLERYKWMSYYLQWLFLRMFEILCIFYPILLAIYYTKLCDLNTRTFDEVKKTINRLELIVILCIALILVTYLIISVLPNFAILIDSNWKLLSQKDNFSSFSGRWVFFNKMRNFAFYYYNALNVILFSVQIIVFMHIKRTMKHKLYYYYNSAMHELKVLLFSHIAFLVFNTMLNVSFLISENGYNFYLGHDFDNDTLNVILWISGLVQYILLFFFIYFSSKYIEISNII